MPCAGFPSWNRPVFFEDECVGQFGLTSIIDENNIFYTNAIIYFMETSLYSNNPDCHPEACGSRPKDPNMLRIGVDLIKRKGVSYAH